MISNWRAERAHRGRVAHALRRLSELNVQLAASGLPLNTPVAALIEHHRNNAVQAAALDAFPVTALETAARSTLAYERVPRLHQPLRDALAALDRRRREGVEA